VLWVVDKNGRRFLFDYDDRGELASRDIVSRAIFNHKKETGEDAYFGFSMFEEKWFHNRFPNITRTLKAIGYNFPTR